MGTKKRNEDGPRKRDGQVPTPGELAEMHLGMATQIGLAQPEGLDIEKVAYQQCVPPARIESWLAALADAPDGRSQVEQIDTRHGKRWRAKGAHLKHCREMAETFPDGDLPPPPRPPEEKMPTLGGMFAAGRMLRRKLLGMPLGAKEKEIIATMERMMPPEEIERAVHISVVYGIPLEPGPRDTLMWADVPPEPEKWKARRLGR